MSDKSYRPMFYIFTLKNGLLLEPENMYGKLFSSFGYRTKSEAQKAIKQAGGDYFILEAYERAWHTLEND